MNPLWEYSSSLIENRVDFRYLPRVLLYYLKFAFFEPLRILESWIYKETIETTDVKNCVFILGYYRSGTTHLHQTLLKDPQFGYLNFYQCLFPNSFLVASPLFKKLFNTYVRITGTLHPAHRIALDLEMPGEEDVAMVASGFRHASNWGQVYPRSFRDFFEKTVFFSDGNPRTEDLFFSQMARLFKRLQIANPERRLLLKSPPQTARMRKIGHRFENSKFLFIRRNPYMVFKSNQRLWTSFEGQCLQKIDYEQANHDILWSYNKSVEYFYEAKREMDSSNVCEISYEDLLSDPMKTLEFVYRQLDLGPFSEIQMTFEEYLKDTHGKNTAKHQIRDDEIELVNKYCGRWIEAWGYEVLTPTSPRTTN